MNTSPELRESTAPVIALEQVRFGWPRQACDLLQIESLRIGRGERVFLHGPSGSGKSTLLSLVAGVLAAQSGCVTVLGESLDSMSGAGRDRFRADHIGIIFQQFNLIPYLSVVENVVLPCHFSVRRRQQATARAGSEKQAALRLLEHLDMADEATLHKPVTELSVGQQQRVAAARALIGAPEILIADEPTSSMDADRRGAFIDLLFHECRESGSTLLFVSHDHGLREPFDRGIELGQLNGAALPAEPRFERTG